MSIYLVSTTRSLLDSTDSSLGKIGNVDFIKRVSHQNLTRVIDSILTDDRSISDGTVRY